MANKDDYEDDDIKDVDLATPSTTSASSKVATKVAGMNAIPQQSDDDEEDEAPSSTQQLLARYAAAKQGPPAQNSLANILSTLSGGQDQKLQQAIDDRNRQQLFSTLGKSAAQIVGGVTHTTPNTAVYDDLAKNAGQGLTDLKTQNDLHLDKLKQADLSQKLITEQDKSDPNSAISKMSVQIAKQLMPNLSLEEGDATAADLEKLNPQLVSLANHRLMQQMREDAASGKASDKADDKVNDRFTKLNQKITAAIGNSRSAFGKAALNNQAVDNAQALLNGQIDPNDLDTRQVYELSRVLDRVLSQGNPTESSTGHLNPDTARSWLAHKMEQVTNTRQGAQAGDFINTISHTLDREKEKAQQQIMNTQGEVLGTETDLADKDPEKWNNMLNAHGISPEYLKAKISGKKQTSSQTKDQNSPYPKDVMDYAKNNNITPDQANQIKMQRTSGQ